MTTVANSRPPLAAKLDNLTLSRKEGWREFASAPKRQRPEQLTRSALRSLGDSALDTYNQRRTDWHCNMGIFKTSQLSSLHDQLWDIIDGSDQDGDKAKGAVALDGYPGLGKTTAMEVFAKDFHHREISRHGEFTRTGDERWPVCRIGMRGNTSMKDFNLALCEFYAHPGRLKGSTEELGKHALDYVLQCETRLLIIDDLHFLHWQHHGGIEINNHFKYIADNFPLLLISIGVGLRDRGVLVEDSSFDEKLSQTARRTTILEIAEFGIQTGKQKREWRTLLLSIEERLVLANKHQGMLADELSDYLYIRSTGYIGSLMELIRRGCARAIRTRTEVLNQKLLDSIRIDSAAEKARQQLAAAFRTRKKTTKIEPR